MLKIIFKIIIALNIVLISPLHAIDGDKKIKEKMLIKHVSKKNYEDVLSLLKESVDADIKSLNYNFKSKPVAVAVKNNDLKMLKLLVEHGANLQQIDSRNKKSLLHFIGEDTSFELLKYLLDMKVDPQQLSVDGESPLHILTNLFELDESSKYVLEIEVDGVKTNTTASKSEQPKCKKSNRLDMIKLLVKQGADINVVNKRYATRDETPIYIAFSQGKPCLVNYFIEQGADPKVGTNPLLELTWKKNLNDVNQLIKHGYDINEISERTGFSPLSKLVQNGFNKDLIELLLKNGANIDLQNTKGDTALSSVLISYNRERKDIASYLLEKGAKKTKNYYQNMLYFIVKKGSLKELQDILDSQKDLLKQEDVYDKSVIMASESSIDKLKLLIAQKQNPNFKNLIYAKALKESLSSKEFDVANYLLSLNLDLSALPSVTNLSRKQSVLALAAKSGNLELIQSIVKSGYGVDRDKSITQSPIIIAVKNGHISIVKYLIDNGADKDVENLFDGSLIDIAKKNNHPEVVEYLESLEK